VALTGWAAHAIFNVPATAYPADGAPFPWVFRLVGDVDLQANASANGGDIRMSLADGTALAYDIVLFDAVVGDVTVVALLPPSDGVTALEVHLDVGNATAVTTQNPAAVHPTSTVLAHCAGDPAVVGAVDSGVTATAPTIVGTLVPARTLSPMGTGFFDDGAGNEVDCSRAFDAYGWTVSYWVADSGAGASVNCCGIGGGAEDILRCDEDGTIPEIAGKHDWLASGGWAFPITPTGWHRRTITYDDATATMSVYEDGVLVGTDVGGNIPAGVAGTYIHFGARHLSAGAFVWDLAELELKTDINTAARELAFYTNQATPTAGFVGWAANTITSALTGTFQLDPLAFTGLATVATYTVTQAFNLMDNSPIPDGVLVTAYLASSFGSNLVFAGSALTLGGQAAVTVNTALPVILIVDYYNVNMGGQVALTNPTVPAVA